MASRLFQKTSLLRQSVRGYATESKQATQEFPVESFGTNAWRNGVIAVVAGLVWFRVDQHMTGSGDEKHPFTRWIEYRMMTTAEENDKVNHTNLAGAEAAAQYKLFYQEAQRSPIHRMRYPEAFERASPRGLAAGNQVDLSDLKIRSD
ncbi:hypothetical protein EDC96DRAFT_497364 [Choanephora cucurbitarum]|nr:hypothetical protein EDC96DRAFT_497364 [Choanephora cucurbitarum]